MGHNSPHDIKSDVVDDRLQLNHSTALANKKCHEKVDFYLHRPVVEYFVIFLIILDALLVTASLLIEIKLIESKAAQGSATTSPHTTDSTGHKKLEHAAEALHYTSLVILSLFMIEIFLKLYGQRVKFFKRKIQVVDSFVVAISFALDIAVIIINDLDSSVVQGVGLIILFRLWRLVRIVNGAVAATKEKLSEKIHEARRETESANEHINQLQMELEDRDREIEFLKGRLCKYEPIDMIPTGSTRLPAYLPETKEFPKQVLGDVTDDEDYRIPGGFADISRLGAGFKHKARTPLDYTGTAFQAYQPGATYQATSQYPTDQLRSHASNQPAVGYRPPHNDGGLTHPPHSAADFHDNDMVDTADESDVVSIKPSKARSGNTFTVKKDGVPMTSL